MIKKSIKYLLVIFVLTIVILIILGGGFGDRHDYTLLNQGQPIIFAHRGFVNYCVENSKESFLKSNRVGFKAIETDINSTKDGKLIIFHDNNSKRLLGIDKSISELNWRDIKSKYLIHQGKQTKNRVLSLNSFLNQVDSSTILYLDIKKTTKAVADSLLYILQQNRKSENTIIGTDNILFLNYIKMKQPTIKICLEGFNKGKEWLYYIIPKNFKPDYYSSFISQVDKEHMTFLNKNSLVKNKIVYGVDTSNINAVLELNIQNIIIDYDYSMGSIDSLKLNLSKIRE